MPQFTLNPRTITPLLAASNQSFVVSQVRKSIGTGRCNAIAKPKWPVTWVLKYPKRSFWSAVRVKNLEAELSIERRHRQEAQESAEKAEVALTNLRVGIGCFFKEAR